MPDPMDRPWKPAPGPAATEPSEPTGASAPLGPMPDPHPRRRRGLWLALALTVLAALGVAVWMANRAAEQREALVEAERARLAAYMAQQEEALAAIPLLTNEEIALLRRSNNAQHVALGRRYGVAPVPTPDDTDGLRDALTRIATNDRYRVQRLHLSIPYVTPDAAASLDLIAVRFAEHLAERGLPPFKFVVTSVLRTEQDQAELRRTNVNAALGASSHFFGTTYDVHYRRFGFAADTRAEVEAALGPLPAGFPVGDFAEELEAFYLDMAEQYATRLGAALGRALIGMESGGKLVAIRERLQPVYHVTIARGDLEALAQATTAPGEGEPAGS